MLQTHMDSAWDVRRWFDLQQKVHKPQGWLQAQARPAGQSQSWQSTSEKVLHLSRDNICWVKVRRVTTSEHWYLRKVIDLFPFKRNIINRLISDNMLKTFFWNTAVLCCSKLAISKTYHFHNTVACWFSAALSGNTTALTLWTVLPYNGPLLFVVVIQPDKQDPFADAIHVAAQRVGIDGRQRLILVWMWHVLELAWSYPSEEQSLRQKNRHKRRNLSNPTIWILMMLCSRCYMAGHKKGSAE